MIEIKKQDRSNKGHEYFQYSVRVAEAYSSLSPWSLTGISQYHSMREWCWQTWGPSKELNEWITDQEQQKYVPTCHNQFWCWQNDEYVRRIYLKTDKEMMLFKLRWE